MNESVVVERLSKQYSIGQVLQETMLRERLGRMFRHPLGLLAHGKETIWALRDVSFRVLEGETLGFIGRNGAGKSTLLKVVSKITYPTSGRVKTNGRVASLLEVGTGFHDELTGRENIYLNGSILGMKKREVDTRLDAIISFSGVEQFIDTPIKRYSSGMRLRLGFAVAAHLNPDILIIDEVLAVGDAGFQKRCLNTMEDLRTSGRTVLFVSHNMGAIASLCPRSIWMEQGRVQMDGRSADVIGSYMKTFVEPQQSRVDLRDVKRRQGTGEIRFTAVELLSTERVPLNIVRAGDRVIFRFKFHAQRAVSHPSVGFRLYTELGALVTSSSTWHNGIDIRNIGTGDGYVEVDVACLNLVPGRYNLSFWVSDGSYGSHVYDELEHCVPLEVEEADRQMWGRTTDSRYGIVFFPQTWDLRGIGQVVESGSTCRDI